MPAHKKKDTTAFTTKATAEIPPEMPDFHQHLRELIRSATRLVMEEVMRDELKQFLGAEWGECTPNGKGIAMERTPAIWQQQAAH